MRTFWQPISVCLPSGKDILDRYAIYDGRAIHDISNKDKIDFIYSVLGVLDAKSASLMQFNGIILAIFAIFIRDNNQNELFSKSGMLVLIASFVSIFLCLLVVALSWRFLEMATTEKGHHSVSNEIDHLCKALWLRERSYQIAWLASVVSVVGLIIFLILNYTHGANLNGISPTETPNGN